MQSRLTTLEEEVAGYEERDVQEAINAKKALDELIASRIVWSKVIQDVVKTVPKDNGKPIVEILSYSGSKSKEIVMNMKTDQEAETPYFDVADLIEAFDDEKKFIENFVPAIAAGTDQDGREILTFSLQTKHFEEDPLATINSDNNLENSIERDEEELGETIGEVLEESVSR